MYVRWQSRKRRKPKFGRYTKRPDIHWSAVLVENVRINGKPTQQYIAYLVGFTESQAAIPAQQRYLWNSARKKLNKLRNRVSPQDRKAIEAAVAKKMGKPLPPTKRERAR
jgi:hypothetical protein